MPYKDIQSLVLDLINALESYTVEDIDGKEETLRLSEAIEDGIIDLLVFDENEKVVNKFVISVKKVI